jgi:hypothetical protein
LLNQLGNLILISFPIRSTRFSSQQTIYPLSKFPLLLTLLALPVKRFSCLLNTLPPLIVLTNTTNAGDNTALSSLQKRMLDACSELCTHSITKVDGVPYLRQF